jgi:hypothetical protein
VVDEGEILREEEIIVNGSPSAGSDGRCGWDLEVWRQANDSGTIMYAAHL